MSSRSEEKKSMMECESKRGRSYILVGIIRLLNKKTEQKKGLCLQEYKGHKENVQRSTYMA